MAPRSPTDPSTRRAVELSWDTGPAAMSSYDAALLDTATLERLLGTAS